MARTRAGCELLSGEAGKAAGRRLLLGAIREEGRDIALGIAVSVGWALIRLCVPLLIKLGIDRAIVGNGSLINYSLIIVAAGVVSGALLGGRRFMAFRSARRVEARMRDRMFAHMQRLHFAFHDRAQTGQLMSRANIDLLHFQNFVMMLPVTLANALTVVVAAVILFVLDPVLAVLALAGMPLANVFGKRFAQRLHPAVMGVQVESAELATVVEETVSGIRVVKGFGAEQLQMDKLEVEAGDVYDRSMEASTVRSIYLPALDIVPNIGLIVVLGYGGHQVINGGLTLGELVSFNIYVIMLIWPLRMLGFIVANWQRATAAGERVDEILATAPLIVDPAHPTPMPVKPQVGEVVFEHVSFAYERDADVAVLTDASMHIEPGESVALVGSTASGKSTIARLIPRFYDVDRGRVLLDGVDVRELRRHELRRQIGIVFEETFLFSASVKDNIAFKDPNAPWEAIERAARLAGAHDFIVDMPLGYETEIGERGYSLSGGQRQRIAIARAIVADPRVLILDDATSAVDPTKEHEIRDALTEVMAGRTTIVIAHRPATIALADRVILLDAGRIVAEGSHKELLAREPRYREVLASAEIRAD